MRIPARKNMLFLAGGGTGDSLAVPYRRAILPLLAVLFWLSPAGCSQSGSSQTARRSPQPAGNLQMGGSLPDFQLDTLDGETYRLADLQDGDSYVCVIFHSPACPCARNCASAIAEEMAGPEYGDLKILGVMSDLNWDYEYMQDDLRKQIEEGVVTFPVVIDKDQSVMETYGAERTPTVWLTDKEGRIRFWGAPENTIEPKLSSYRFLLKEALDALKRGEEPEVTRFDPVGCLITVKQG